MKITVTVTKNILIGNKFWIQRESKSSSEIALPTKCLQHQCYNMPTWDDQDPDKETTTTLTNTRKARSKKSDFLHHLLMPVATSFCFALLDDDIFFAS
jgi:hypothetical protein